MSVDFEEIRGAWLASTPIDAAQEVDRLANRALKKAQGEKIGSYTMFVAAVAAMLLLVFAVYPPSLVNFVVAMVFLIPAVHQVWSQRRLSQMLIHWDPHLFHDSVFDLVAALRSQLKMRIFAERTTPVYMLALWVWLMYLRAGSQFSMIIGRVIADGLPPILFYLGITAYICVQTRRERIATERELAAISRVAAEYARYAPSGRSLANDSDPDEESVQG